MTTEAERLMIEHFQAVRSSQDRTETEVHDIRPGVSAVETRVGTLSSRMHRFDEGLMGHARPPDLADA